MIGEGRIYSDSDITGAAGGGVMYGLYQQVCSHLALMYFSRSTSLSPVSGYYPTNGERGNVSPSSSSHQVVIDVVPVLTLANLVKGSLPVT